MTPFRSRSLAIGLVVLFVIGGCGVLSNSPAATVNGRDISDASLQDELSAIRDNPTYRSRVEQGMQTSQSGESPGTFDTTFIARLLTQRVYYELIEAELTKRKAKITEADLKEVRPLVIQQVGDEKVFKSFPKDYQDQLIRQRALFKKLNELFAKDIDGGNPKSYFDKHADEFVQGCSSHILISSQDKDPEAAKAEAVALKAKIAKGADFAQVAKESSGDPGSAQQGGDLGCVGKGSFVPEFEAALFSLPLGVVSDPIQTQYGYHLILVRERKQPTYQEAKANVQAAIAALSSQELEKFLIKSSERAKVSIDKRYGTWEIKKGATDGTPDGVGVVVPPKAPGTTTTTSPVVTSSPQSSQTTR